MKIDRPDEQTTWYFPITEEKAQHILVAEGRPNLKFLLSRPSFIEDANGIRRVSGQPDKLCYGQESIGKYRPSCSSGNVV